MTKGNTVLDNDRRKRPLPRWFKISAIALALVIILVLAPLAVLLYPTLKSYPNAPDQTSVSLLEANRQDIAHLRHLPNYERSFTPEAKAEFARALSAMEERAADMDRADLAMAAAKAVALADNGHSNVAGLVGGQSFNAVPVRLGWFADGLFVVAAARDQSHLLGAQVLGANGKTTDALLAALRPYVGGPANLAKEFAPNFMTSPELLHAAGLAETSGKSTYDMRLSDGSSVSTELAALPGTDEPLRANFWPARDLSPVAHANRPTGWRHVLEDVALPDYLAQLDRNYWHAYPAADLLYVQINRVRDQAPVDLSQYLSDVLDELSNKPIRNAIVDLRFNAGGNYTLSADFARRLPELLPPTGRLFILTTGNTFSAAISTAAWLKYYGGERVTIVGEAVGDRMQFWGEGGLTVLPHSKLAVRYTTGFHDWENGCSLSQLRTCFLLNYIYDVPAGSLEPDVIAQPTFADYVAGKDRAMSVVLERLAAVGSQDKSADQAALAGRR
ncbi:MAG TPA: hypothetical protein VGO04_30790 [Ensifer sp.]|jgi:hypothetical protein|uniref:hypothetical protein n=1 Tax=Ensifer sp. TaxID=1872086 RepID=UPI002E1391EA|nr:hypothetical protein [Ensifer sp.]